ncbi:MAG: polysaccharide pyruvyl transferase family protein [Nitrospirota bacterium]
MRILIDNGSYHLRNCGDVALLQAAVSRVADLWPGALIEVITGDPDRLQEHCPGVRPLLSRGKTLWYRERTVFGPVHRFVPRPVAQHLAHVEGALRYRWPSLAHSLISTGLRREGIDTAALNAYRDALRGADLVIACGGGYITDAFKVHAIRLLDTLGMAARLGTPTALFGQGIGPVWDGSLRKKLAAVLPSAALIGLRENRFGRPLIAALGVSPDRIAITGDDAVETAYNARSAVLGTGIGVNVRVAPYSGVRDETVDRIKRAVQETARKHDAPLVPVPISLHEKESDARTIRSILSGYGEVSDGGEQLDTPIKVMRQIGQCRVVVTGSYHGAVFALSQGVPAIGLAHSPYYVHKFLGLADQFDGCCSVVLLHREQFDDKLSLALDDALRSAERIRPRLLAAAERQCASARAAYRRICDVVEARRTRGRYREA